MGMRATILNREYKISGCLAKAIAKAARIYAIPGVDLSEDGLISGGVVVLRKEDVEAVIWELRELIVSGEAMKPSLGNEPLTNLQDISHYAHAVDAYCTMTWWALQFSKAGEKIVFS